MAAPTFGAAGTQFQGSPGTTVSVDVPDGVVANSIIVITVFVDTPTATITALPSGFTNAADSPVVGGSNRTYIFWKRATGSESTAGTYDYTTSASVYNNAQAIRYDGAVTSGDPWDVTASAVDNTSGTVTPAVSDTTTVPDTLIVFAGTDWAGGTWTPPTGYTERRDSGDGVCTVADLAQTSAGSTGSVSATCTGSDRRTAWIGALKSTSGVTADPTGWPAPALLPGVIGPDGQVFLPNRFDDIFGPSATNAPAGQAAGTGAAQDPTRIVAPVVSAATATGVANNPTVTTGSATNAPAGQAAATGTANNPQPSVAPVAGQAGATGVANNASPSVAIGVGQASGTGAAQTASRIVAPVPAPATATGTAFNPTVITGSFTNANAQTATATGVANNPTSKVATGPSTASGTGTANNAAVSVGGATSAVAGTATATGVANAAATLVGPAPATASATGLAIAPARWVNTIPATATAVGQAFPASMFVGVVVTPDARTFVVPYETNTLKVTVELRVLEVAERRQVRVTAEDRTMVFPAERTVPVP